MEYWHWLRSLASGDGGERGVAMDGGWHTFDWPNLWGYWWLFMIFWWCGGMRFLGGASRRMRRGLASSRREDAALTTLRERFARGEIDRAEYEERRAVLRGRQPRAAAIPAPQKSDGPAWPDLP